MAMSAQAISALKNRWLASQIDVEFPTPESRAGYALYQQRIAHAITEPLHLSLDNQAAHFSADDLFLVDFHRLTIFFAQLQAQVWQTPEQQALTIEFFTQIIYSEPCDLYLGFQAGEPVACAILTQQEETALISDVVTLGNDATLAEDFVRALMQRCQLKDRAEIFIESISNR